MPASPEVLQVATGQLKTHLALGAWGEALVAHRFAKLGFTILERNWRGGGGELDLVCSREELIVFVEVRTRSSRFLDSPTMTVNGQKQLKVSKAASAWLMAHETDYDSIRFDVVGVVADDEGAGIEHIENAFVPQWAY